MATTSEAATVSPSARRAMSERLLVSTRNVENNLELEQRGTGGHRVGLLTFVGFDSGPSRPGLESLLGLPLRHHEVAVLALDGTQKLKAEEARLVVDCVGPVREPLLQFRTGVGRDLDRVDLHHRILAGHAHQATECSAAARRHDDVRMQSSAGKRSPLTHRGGRGRPLVLVHGLMGRGSTWSRQLPWLTRLGEVYTYDAPWHRGRDIEDARPISTERFVAELGDAVATIGQPAVMIGHSMGGLHSWCLAATRPDLVEAVVVEDMAPDFRGRTTGPWEPWLHALPVEFDSAERVYQEFGPVAGQYFLEAFDRIPSGWRLHGRTDVWIEIAAEWGTRDYWREWEAVRVPALLIEAGNSVTPPGQMARMAETGPRTTYLRVPEAGHLVHDDAPQAYRRAVESFLATLPDRT